MNLEMHEWDIPTINLLGAVDNCKGDGQWADGYQNGDDIYHPNHTGHTEMMHTIVPSLFDALAAGKVKPVRQTGEGIALAGKQKIEFVPEDEVHSFTLAFRVANIGNMKLSLELKEGTAPAQPANLPADANWHAIVISHYYAAGKTYIYLDGVQQNVSDGKMILDQLTISGACAISDLHFWRAGMNADEVAAFGAGKMLCSSLELYCPLNDGNTANLAQSTNVVKLVSDETALEGTNSKMANDQMGNAFTILGQPANPSFRGGVLIIDGKKVLK